MRCTLIHDSSARHHGEKRLRGMTPVRKAFAQPTASLRDQSTDLAKAARGWTTEVGLLLSALVLML